MPDHLPRLDVADAFARGQLPLHLNWSARGRVFDLGSRADRARVYEIVLQEGRPADILAYVDGALLLDLWADLVLPQAIRSAWAPVIQASRAAAAEMPGTASGDESGTDGTPGLTDFQLEVARLFFSLPASKGFLLAGEPLCSRSTSRRGPRKTSISSPLHRLATSLRHATRWRLPLGSAAGEPSASTTATHSADRNRSGTAETLTDLAVNAPPDFPASLTSAGPHSGSRGTHRGGLPVHHLGASHGTADDGFVDDRP